MLLFVCVVVVDVVDVVYELLAVNSSKLLMKRINKLLISKDYDVERKSDRATETDREREGEREIQVEVDSW